MYMCMYIYLYHISKSTSSKIKRKFNLNKKRSKMRGNLWSFILSDLWNILKIKIVNTFVLGKTDVEAIHVQKV